MQRGQTAIWTLAAALLMLAGNDVWAQTKATRVSDAAAESTRDEQFTELAKDAAQFEAQFGLFKRIVKLVKPSVVHIEAAIDFSQGEKKNNSEEAGSGVIARIHDRLYVLTNRHVINGAVPSRIKIKLADGRLIYPTKVWADRGTDVAVLAISTSKLLPARIGDSDAVEIGDHVLAVGSPFGLSHTVTYGIIGAKGRRDLELGDDGVRFQDFLQTDAAINPGNSGGPLVNLRGEVIGLNTAIASNGGGSEGIGFTIPINMVVHVASQLIERGHVARAFLGVHLDSKFSAEQAIKLGLNRGTGARISAVTSGSPAESAGMEVGDIVLEYESTQIEDDGHLVNLVSATPINTKVTVRLWRKGRSQSVDVRVGDRGQFEPEQ
jgi:serine protease Do